MGLFVTSLLLVVFLVGTCTPQDSQVNLEVTLKNLLDGQIKIFQKLADQVENCATRAQVDAFKTTFVTEQEDVKNSLQMCSTKQQIITLQDLLGADECDDGRNTCSALATCTDTNIGFKCSCKQGYSGDGFTCQDINECESGVHACHAHATCTNNIGSYTCECLPYFDGDGYTCNAPVCQAPSQVIPGLGCVIPVTELMTWDAAKENCETQGLRLLEGIRAVHLQPLKQHFKEFFMNIDGTKYCHIGFRGGVWVKSGTPSVPEENLWLRGYPQGTPQKKNDCGRINLPYRTTHLFDAWCHIEAFSLCQLIS